MTPFFGPVDLTSFLVRAQALCSWGVSSVSNSVGVSVSRAEWRRRVLLEVLDVVGYCDAELFHGAPRSGVEDGATLR